MMPHANLFAAAIFVLAGLAVSRAYATDAAGAATAVPAAVAASVAYPGRPPADRDRDGQRKPAEALAFAGVKPGDQVTDFIPGDGYYTRILSHIVGNAGHVYAFVPFPGGVLDSSQERAAEAAMRAKGVAPPPNPVDAALAVQDIGEYGRNDTVIWERLDQYGGQFGLPVPIDVIWTSGHYSELHTPAYNDLDMAAVTRAIFRATAPGGTYVVSDYAAAPGAGFAGAATLHRSDPEAVKAEITAAGFTFDGSSALLANAADDRAKPARPGDDMFLLRFMKPLSATGDKRPGPHAMDNYYHNTYIYDLGARLERRHFYYPDGTYQEFGQNSAANLQEGQWYWDADGHNCQLHQFPPGQRGFVVCHAFTVHPVGDVWIQDNGMGAGPKKVTIIPGYHALPH